ncbi:MAG: stage V sporulation protein AE [Dehalobacterium sp.]|jgi:stage V sporulation protein AE
MNQEKRKVIIITDGDEVAKDTIEKVAKKVGGCCISASAGNPTPISGEEIVALIKEARSDPVLVMVDDKGCCSKGKGEEALEYIAKSKEVKLIGVLAVASNTMFSQGVSIEHAITMNGQMIHGPVNKDGKPEKKGHHVLEGDTVGVLNELKNEIPMIIGIGDIGKMHGHDHGARGGKITTQAIKHLLKKDGESGDS